MLTCSRNLSFRQWKAIHIALKEWDPAGLMSGETQPEDASDEPEVADVPKLPEQLEQLEQSKLAKQPIQPEKPENTWPTPKSIGIENWQVVGALCVLQSPRRLEDHQVQRRTVQLVVAAVERQFAEAIKQDKEQALHHYSKQIYKPVQSLSAYLEPLQPSGCFEFITHLRIAAYCNFTQQDLVVLTGLQSLGVLEIIETLAEQSAFPRVTDDVLRAWSLAKDPFPKLTILKLHSRQDLTLRSLKYVAQFPRLVLFSVWGKDSYWQVEGQISEWRRCSSICLKSQQSFHDIHRVSLNWGHLAYCRYQNHPALVTKFDSDQDCRGAVPVVSLGLGLDPSSNSHQPPETRGLQEKESWLVFCAVASSQ